MPDARAMTWDEAERFELYYHAKGDEHEGPFFYDECCRAIALARQERERAEGYKETALLETGLREAAEAEIHALRSRADALAEVVEGYITVNKRENVHSLFWRERAKFYQQMGERLAAYREGA